MAYILQERQLCEREFACLRGQLIPVYTEHQSTAATSADYRDSAIERTAFPGHSIPTELEVDGKRLAAGCCSLTAEKLGRPHQSCDLEETCRLF